MQKKTSRNRNSQKPQQNISVILADGTPASISRKNLGKMTKYSGTASDGTEVHSLEAKQIGQSTVIRDSQGTVSSFKTNELQVLAAGIFDLNDLSKVKSATK